MGWPCLGSCMGVMSIMRSTVRSGPNMAQDRSVNGLNWCADESSQCLLEG